MQRPSQKVFKSMAVISFCWVVGTRFSAQTQKHSALIKPVKTGRSPHLKGSPLNFVGTVKNYIIILQQGAEC
jgi:hypothetical protein